MPYWAKIIPLLLLLSGLIAYLGDELGRRLGKRKVKLFGLRPKKTSVLITIVAGMVTTGATITFFAVVSDNVRIALTSVDLFRFEIQKLEKDSRALQGRYEVALAKEKSARQKEMKALADEKRLRQNLSLEKQRAGELKRELVALAQEISGSKVLKDKLEKDLTLKQTALVALRQQVKEAQRQRDQVDKQMGALTREYLNQEKKNTELAATVGTLQKSATTLQKKVSDLNDQVARHQRELLHARVLINQDQLLETLTAPANLRAGALASALANRLKALNQDLFNRGARYQGQQALLFYEPQLDSLVAGMEPDKSYVIRVFSATNVFFGQPVVARFEVSEDRLVFRAGEVIVKKTFHPKENGRPAKTREQAEGLLQSLLLQGRREAIKKGMLSSPGGVGQVKASELLRAAESVARSKGPVEVSMVARENTYRASVLSVDFKIRPLGVRP